MKESLGKRIVANRKRLGLTQDVLAEMLGVTPQAVSKWENDQSCPDITILPKLSQIFGISTDALLGLKEEAVPEPVVSTLETEPDGEPEGIHIQKGQWDIHLGSGRRSGIGFGLWVLTVGGALLYLAITDQQIPFLDLLWPSALLVFGLLGIWPGFSLFRLGCGLFGAYSLLDILNIVPHSMEARLILPLFLVSAGILLIVKAFLMPKGKRCHILRSGRHGTRSGFSIDGEHFACSSSFAENRRLLTMPRLATGSIQNSFAETSLDFTGCEEFSENCRIDASCSFGEVELTFPRCCRVVPDLATTFAEVSVSGHPDADAAREIQLTGSVSFGQITIRYV